MPGNRDIAQVGCNTIVFIETDLYYCKWCRVVTDLNRRKITTAHHELVVGALRCNGFLYRGTGENCTTINDTLYKDLFLLYVLVFWWVIVGCGVK